MIEKEIYVVRHGQTDLNAQGIVQGKGVNHPLNETGQKQALAFFNAYSHIPFEILFSSSLLRAQQTIEPFKQNSIQHISSSNLDEISWGEAEGKKGFTDHSEIFFQLMDEWKNGNVHFKLPGGESPYELQQRQLIFIDELKTIPQRKILIATHGRFIRSFMCTVTHTPLAEMENFKHSNLCLYKIHLHGSGEFEIVVNNNVEHLPLEMRT